MHLLCTSGRVTTCRAWWDRRGKCVLGVAVRVEIAAMHKKLCSMVISFHF